MHAWCRVLRSRGAGAAVFRFRVPGGGASSAKVKLGQEVVIACNELMDGLLILPTVVVVVMVLMLRERAPKAAAKPRATRPTVQKLTCVLKVQDLCVALSTWGARPGRSGHATQVPAKWPSRGR